MSGAATGSAQPLREPLDGLPAPRRYWAIATIVLAIAVSVLDSSIANIALPTLAQHFHASAAASIWVVNAYQIAILIALLPLASLGEVIGYRHISQGGLIVFTTASLGCALAPSLDALIAARVVQGLGAAGIMSVSPALVRFTYPQHLLGRALGLNALAVATSAAIGPTLAAAVLAVANWRWLFAINVPIGIVAVLIGLYALPRTEQRRRPLNYVGAALHAGGFGLTLVALQALAHASASWRVYVPLLFGCLCLALLARHELSRETPLIPFDLLRARLFTLSLLTSVCSFVAQGAALVALPFDIQRLGRTAVETGLLMTPWPLALALIAPLAGRLADRHPAGLLGGIGLVALTCGLTLLALLPADASNGDIIWRMLVCGLGFGLFQAPNNRAIILAAPRARSGSAGGMLSTARLLGQSLGVAGVAILLRSYPARGLNLALLAAALVCVFAALISIARLGAAPAAATQG